MCTYQELLNRDEWKTKRQQIILGHGYKCQICNNEKYLDDNKTGMYIWKNGSFYSIVHETDNTHGIWIYTTSVNKEFLKRSFIPINAGFKPGSTCVAFYKELPGHFGLSIIALRKIEIPYPLILRNDFVSENETKYMLNEQATQELENKNWEFFDWMFVRGLHVHHKFYIRGKNPWEYENSALSTLCWHCHEKLHKGGKTAELDEDGNFLRELTYCTRCHGAGWFPEFHHVESGICFKCRGARYEELIES
jgi:5-methylcytosine-specific restriction endonuclease McrA